MNMNKTILSLAVGLGLAVSAWAVPPYIGEVATSWASTNAVKVTAGSVATNSFYIEWISPTNMINGGAFTAYAGAGSKPTYEGAEGNSDGTNHTYGPLDNAWIGYMSGPTGLPNPTGRTTTTTNVGGVHNYAQNWISFEFDKPYEITSFDIWNGSYCGGAGSPAIGERGGDRSLMDVYIDYKTNGVWFMAANTIRLARVPDIFDWYPPTDNIPVGQKNVSQVVITPIKSWAEDTAWYYEGSHANDYFTPYACVSEVRFYVPPTPPSLTIGLQGTNVTVSWPSNVVGYNLESSTVLGTGASWNPVNGVVNNSVTIPNPAGTQFYRLKQQ